MPRYWTGEEERPPPRGPTGPELRPLVSDAAAVVLLLALGLVLAVAVLVTGSGRRAPAVAPPSRPGPGWTAVAFSRPASPAPSHAPSWSHPEPLVGPYGWTGVLVAALVTVTAWAALERYRWRREHEQVHEWRAAYWHLLATARCPLCGTRAEPETAPAPEHEPSKGEL